MFAGKARVRVVPGTVVLRKQPFFALAADQSIVPQARCGEIRSLHEFAGNELSAICDEWKSSAGVTRRYRHLDFRCELST